MSTYLTNASLQTLNMMIGQTLRTITADDWKPFGQSLGNILIETNSSYFAIYNDFEEVKMWTDVEELMSFSVDELTCKHDFFEGTITDTMVTETVNQTIANITIVRDTMKFIYQDRVDTYVLDRGIIIDLQNYKWLVGQYSIFSPINYMCFDVDIKTHLPSLEELREIFAYDPDSGQPAYRVTVTREFINVKEQYEQ